MSTSSPALAGGERRERTWWAARAVIALLALVPLLATRPGRVAADTKSYLTIDPGRLLSDALSMWDPGVGLGTVTHQNIGYLWPMGPFFWSCDRLGVPDWVTQRLWLATIITLAGWGVLFLVRTLGRDHLRPIGPGPALVAAISYCLGPYLIHYSARISVILLPWAALGWILALGHRGVRRSGWRDPALIALVSATAGGINATSLLLVGLGPAVWLVVLVATEPDVSWRQLGALIGRLAVCALPVNLWWVAGLSIQGEYGVEILRFTESYRAVAVASSANEILRGLGYWFIYGSDKLGSWIQASVAPMTALWLLALTSLIPVAALTSSVVTRWRYRLPNLLMLLVGLVVAVGGYPWEESSVFGEGFRWFTQFDAGLALRSTARAAPLVALALALEIGVGLEVAARRLGGRRVGPAHISTILLATCACLLVAAQPALWRGQLVDPGLDRASELPDYWTEAAEAIDAADDGTRVIEIPGSDFAAYRWGNTVDPITPGLIDRPYVARELIPYGTDPAAALVNAIDAPLQLGTWDPDALVTLSRLISAGEIVVRNDLEFERFRTPRPGRLTEGLRRADGIDGHVEHGERQVNRAGPILPMIDEIELIQPPGDERVAPVERFIVDSAPTVVHLLDTARPVVVAGDAEGVVDLAEAGLLDPERLLILESTIDDEELVRLLDEGADLVVTDTNRSQARRWGTVRENLGHAERRDEEPLVDDPSDNRLDLPIAEGIEEVGTRTWADHGSQLAVTATGYGNPITFVPANRAVHAIDGDPATEWTVGAFSDVRGERLVIDLAEPTPADVLVLAPALGNRWINWIRVWRDGEPSAPFELVDPARRPRQFVELDAGPPASRVEIEILDTNWGRQTRYDRLSGVGFTEIAIGESLEAALARPPLADERLELPVGLLDRVGPRVARHDLTFVMTRDRVDPAEPVAIDGERALDRMMTLSAPMTARLTGTARLSPRAEPEVLDELRGRHESGPVVTASHRLPGDISSGPSAAFDGDPETAWQGPVTVTRESWWQVEFGETTAVTSLTLDVWADRRHSVPTAVQLVVDGESGPVLDVPAIRRHPDSERHVERVEIDLPSEVQGSTFRVVLADTDNVTATDWYTLEQLDLPVAIAEIELGGPVSPRSVGPAEPLGRICRDDLLTLDGEPLPVRFVDDAPEDPSPLRRRSIGIEACRTLDLRAGQHRLVAAVGSETGLDIDQLVITRPPNEASSDAEHSEAVPIFGRPGSHTSGPAGVLVEHSATRMSATIPAGGDRWLVLGQSLSAGWSARVESTSGDDLDLGPPLLVQGYANGWRLSGSDVEQTVILEWAPQERVATALIVSLVAAALLVLVALVGPRGVSLRSLGGDPCFAGGTAAPAQNRSAAWRGAVVVATGLGAALTVSPVGGLLVAGVAAVSMLAGQRTWPVGLVPLIGCLSTAYVVAFQYRRGFKADFDWPVHFGAVHEPTLIMVWIAVVAGIVWGRAR